MRSHAFASRELCRTRQLLTGVLSWVVSSACATAEVPVDSERQAWTVRTRAPERVLRRGEIVPEFRVETFDGAVLDSRDLVGQRPFTLVFFATWCPVCQYKLPVVRALTDEFARDVTFIGVALDHPEDRDRALGYISRHQLTFPMVDGLRFARFTFAYDPSGTVPVVIVIGKDGYLLEYQSGFSWRDERRLRAALAAARSSPDEAPPTVVERGQ